MATRAPSRGHGQIVASPHCPAWWLPGPHLPTLWASLAPRPGLLRPPRWERLELPDGDFLDLVHVGPMGSLAVGLARDGSPSPHPLPPGERDKNKSPAAAFGVAAAGAASGAVAADPIGPSLRSGEGREEVRNKSTVSEAAGAAGFFASSLPWGEGENESAGAPRILLLHGLEGSVRSGYCRGLLAALERAGLAATLMHFRGCGGTPNRLPRTYHAGDTADLRHLVGVLRARAPSAPLAAVGYSLGGNVLLKYLGEEGGETPLVAAVAVSVPFELIQCAIRMQQGFSRAYQRYLLWGLREKIRTKFAHGPCPISLDGLDGLWDFHDFDDRITAPLHGMSGVEEYYRRASSRQFLRGIAIPTLLLQAVDDPFLHPAALPLSTDLAPAVTLELSPHGGHVGFVEGDIPGQADYYLDRRIPAFLLAELRRSIARVE